MNDTIRQVKIGIPFSVKFIEEPHTGYVWSLEENQNFDIEVKSFPVNSYIPAEYYKQKINKEFILSAKNHGKYKISFIKERSWSRMSGVVDRYSEIIEVT